MKTESTQARKAVMSSSSLVNQKLDQLNQAMASANDTENLALIDIQNQQRVPHVIRNPKAHQALEYVDEIHDEQNEKLTSGIPMLDNELMTWAKINYMPCQMDSIMSLAIMDARRQQERRDNQLSEEDFYKVSDQMEDLERIKKRFKINIDHEHFNQDPQLFKSFMSMNPRSYYTFKNNSNVSRTLVKGNFKPKQKTGVEKRATDVILMNQLDQKNQETMKRLREELNELKVYNKPLYLSNLRKLNWVIDSQKQGFSAVKIKQMLSELPSSFLPDEQDIELHKTVSKFESNLNVFHPLTGSQTELNSPRTEEQYFPELNKTDSTENVNDSILSIAQPNDAQHINFADFSIQQDVNKNKTKLKLKKGKLIDSTYRKTDKKSPQELQQIEMQMKRKVPQLYINKNANKAEKVNDFNSILQRSLLSPERSRLVTNKRDQLLLDRKNHLSQKTKRKGYETTRSKKRDYQQAIAEPDNSHLPIISVGNSLNDSLVDFKQNSASKEDLTTNQQAFDQSTQDVARKPYKRINNRFQRKKQSVTISTNQAENLVQSHEESLLSSPQSMRGVSPMIRGHVRNRSHNVNSDVFMTNLKDMYGVSSSHANSKKSIVDNQMSKILGTRNASKHHYESAKSGKANAVPIHRQMVQDIITKVGVLRGTDPTGSNLQTLNEKVQKQMLSMQIRNKYIFDTADQVQQFSEYQPVILKWLFNEHIESIEDENETQRNAIIDFENRKLDYKYFNMIENRERSNFNKQVKAAKNLRD